MPAGARGGGALGRGGGCGTLRVGCRGELRDRLGERARVRLGVRQRRADRGKLMHGRRDRRVRLRRPLLGSGEGGGGLLMLAAGLPQRNARRLDRRAGRVESRCRVRLEVLDRLATDGAGVARLERALQRHCGVAQLRGFKSRGGLGRLALRGGEGGGSGLSRLGRGLPACGGRPVPRPRFFCGVEREGEPLRERLDAAAELVAIRGGGLGRGAPSLGRLGVTAERRRNRAGTRRGGGQQLAARLPSRRGFPRSGVGDARFARARGSRLLCRCGGRLCGLELLARVLHRREGSRALFQQCGRALEAPVDVGVVAEVRQLRRRTLAASVRIVVVGDRLAQGLFGLRHGPVGGQRGRRGVLACAGGLAGGLRRLVQRDEQRAARLEGGGAGGERVVLDLEGGDRLGRGRAQPLELEPQRVGGGGRAGGAVTGVAPDLLVEIEAEQAREDLAALGLVASEEGVERTLREQDRLRERLEVEPDQTGHAVRHLAGAVGKRLPATVGGLPLEACADAAGRLTADAVALAADGEVEAHGHRLRTVGDELAGGAPDARHLPVERPRHRVQQRRLACAGGAGDREEAAPLEVEDSRVTERGEPTQLEAQRLHRPATASGSGASGRGDSRRAPARSASSSSAPPASAARTSPASESSSPKRASSSGAGSAPWCAR